MGDETLKIGNATIRKRSIVEYRLNPKNHNVGSERGKALIAHSFRKYKAGRSLLADANDTLIAGNQSIQGAMDAGIINVIEVEADGSTLVVVKRLDLDLEQDHEAVEMAYIDNRASEVSLHYDVSQVAADIADGVDLTEMFLPDELLAMLPDAYPDDPTAVSEAPDTDRGAELREKWHTETGQLWLIPSKHGGVHRLLISDCRNEDDMKRLCITKVQGVVTSPPYAEQRSHTYGGVPVEEYTRWWSAVQHNVKTHLLDDGSFFVNIKAHTEGGQRSLYVMDLVCQMVRKWEWRFVDEFCWKRPAVPGAWADRFKNEFEPVYHFAMGKINKFYPERVGHASDSIPVPASIAGAVSNSGTGTYWNMSNQTKEGIALPGNVIEVSGVEAEVGHSAMFPVGLPEFFMKAFSDDGDVWLDPFMGGGTTIAAAEHCKRIAYGIELLPENAALILERFSELGPELHEQA